jgi:hypothetical protein
MAIQASLTDDLIDTQFIYTPLTGTISQQYSDILTNAALPYEAISATDQAEIDADNRWLSNNETTYTTFQGYYLDALQAYSQEANSQNPDPTKVARLNAKVTQTYKDWETMGLKNQYETKQARVIYLQSGDPATMWSNFQTLLQFHSKHAPHRGDYVQNFLLPPVAQWNSPGTSWAQFEKTINESDTYNYSSETSWGGGGSVGWGLFSLGSGASGSSSYSHSESDVTTVDIKFDSCLSG